MKAVVVYLTILLLFSLQTGCRNDHGLSSENPVTLTLWHNYGGQMKETMDGMVDEFNETVGSEMGIIINVTSVSSSNALHEKLVMIASGDAGAPKMPDIATANPRTAIILADKGLLADLHSQFTKKELDAYIPRFLEEGTLGTDQLYIFPIAKSTEALFLNKTVFDRFMDETNADYEDLSTFEGIAETAALYHAWTDALTPDISDDGKAFFHADSLFNLAQIGCRQLGSDFIKENRPDFSSEAFRRVWDFYFNSAVRGYFSVYDGYASDLFKTGEIICSIGSTAGVLFFDPVVTYPDNTTETVELMILPYPIFSGGDRIAVQRGGGMIVSKTDETREYASGIFMKWFTSPENNLRFVSSTGYLPVTREAYGEIMTKNIDTAKSGNIRSLLKTSVNMQADYDFYIPPLFDGIDALQENYTIRLMTSISDNRTVYQRLLPSAGPDTAFQNATKYAFENFTKEIQ